MGEGGPLAVDEELVCVWRHLIRHGVAAPPVSLRLGHTRVLTSHRDVIHCARAASLPTGEGFLFHCAQNGRPMVAPTGMIRV